jgi:hypothetical protein
MKNSILVLVTLLVIISLFFGACKPKTQTATPVLTITPTPTSNEITIKDLAYIKILTTGYSDDSDPQEDGIGVDIQFYDSRSETITFYDISVTVNIEIYGYRYIFDTFDHDKMVLVSQQLVSVDHSMRISEMFGKYIRIPFENINIDQSKYIELGTIKVTVTTPKQGDFQDMEDLVSLYAKD